MLWNVVRPPPMGADIYMFVSIATFLPDKIPLSFLALFYIVRGIKKQAPLTFASEFCIQCLLTSLII